jgi:hypothetical protein
MTQDSRKPSGSAQDTSHKDAVKKQEKAPTYQEALDEAVEETFPASDPISPGVAEKADRKVSTPKDPVDWKAPQNKDDARKK